MQAPQTSYLTRTRDCFTGCLFGRRSRALPYTREVQLEEVESGVRLARLFLMLGGSVFPSLAFSSALLNFGMSIVDGCTHCTHPETAEQRASRDEPGCSESMHGFSIGFELCWLPVMAVRSAPFEDTNLSRVAVISIKIWCGERLGHYLEGPRNQRRRLTDGHVADDLMMAAGLLHGPRERRAPLNRPGAFAEVNQHDIAHLAMDARDERINDHETSHEATPHDGLPTDAPMSSRP